MAPFTNVTFALFKNGVEIPNTRQGGSTPTLANAKTTIVGETIIDLLAGDIITLRNVGGGVSVLGSNLDSCNSVSINIHKISL